MEEKVISYKTGKEGDKESPLIPTTDPYTAARFCPSAASLCSASLIISQNKKLKNINNIN